MDSLRIISISIVLIVLSAVERVTIHMHHSTPIVEMENLNVEPSKRLDNNKDKISFIINIEGNIESIFI